MVYYYIRQEGDGYAAYVSADGAEWTRQDLPEDQIAQYMTVDGINDADFICLKFILPPFHHLRDTQQFCVLSSQLTGDVKTVTRSGKIKDL